MPAMVRIHLNVTFLSDRSARGMVEGNVMKDILLMRKMILRHSNWENIAPQRSLMLQEL